MTCMFWQLLRSSFLAAVNTPITLHSHGSGFVRSSSDASRRNPIIRDTFFQSSTVNKHVIASYADDLDLLYNDLDLNWMCDRIILSLPLKNEFVARIECSQLIKYSLRGIADTEKYFERMKQNKKLFVFSGEGGFVDSKSYHIDYAHFGSSKPFNHYELKDANKHNLRYLRMYYDHTITVFRPGIIHFLHALNQIGEHIKADFDILFYCQRHQFKQFVSYSAMIQMFINVNYGPNALRHVRFIGVVTTKVAKIKENVNPHGKSFEALSEIINTNNYDQIMVLDSNEFDASPDSQICVQNITKYQAQSRMDNDNALDKIDDAYSTLLDQCKSFFVRV